MAKNDVAATKGREGAIYAQAQATKTMVEAHMKKVVLLEEQNLLMLMMMPDESATAPEAREYLALRRSEELKKLRKRMAKEERMAEEEAKQAELVKELKQ